MRPLEILVSLANLLAFCIVATPRLRAIHWMGYLALITALIAGIQILVEGPRWEMIPAYVFAGLLALVWLLQNFAPAGGIIGQLLTNRFTIGLSVGLGVLGLAVSIALPVVLPVFHFPRPTGPYQIGTVTYHWVEPHGLFSWLFLDSPPLLPFSLSILLVLPPHMSGASCSAQLSLTRSAMNSSTISLRNSWAQAVSREHGRVVLPKT